MKGKDCVAIAADRRFGVQLMTYAMDFQKVFEINEKTYVALPGLATDVQTLYEKFRFKSNVYKLKEEKDITPKKFAHLVSSTLYEKRFGPYYCEPIIAGLEPDGSPFVCSMDLIGCINFAKDFVVGGTATNQLYGMAESLWEPNLEEEDLFEIAAQTLMNATDRDASSGSGCIVYLIGKNGVTTRIVRARMD